MNTPGVPISLDCLYNISMIPTLDQSTARLSVCLLYRGVLASKNDRLLALKTRGCHAKEELQDNTRQLSSIEEDLKKIETMLQVF